MLNGVIMLGHLQGILNLPNFGEEIEDIDKKKVASKVKIVEDISFKVSRD